MLQNNPVVAKIRSGLVKRVLGELEKKAKKDADTYAAFWDTFGAVLKEGIYEDFANRDRLVELARFHTTGATDGRASLADVIGRMKDGQDAIYYISGDNLETVRRSPQLEAFKARGVEVLLFTDPVDEFWVTSVGTYQDKPFKSVTRGGIDLDKIAGDDKGDDKAGDGSDDKAAASDIDSLIASFKLTLAEAVKDVHVSARLTESPVCLVADEGDLDMHIERVLKEHNRITESSSRILEINPDHPLIRTLAGLVGKDGTADDLADAARLLLDQARIVEGEPLPDAVAFAQRLAGFMRKGLAA